MTVWTEAYATSGTKFECPHCYREFSGMYMESHIAECPRRRSSETTKSIEADDTTVGTVYEVAWDDCCAGGEFTSKLVEKKFSDQEPDFLESLTFENGVTLYTLFGYTITEVEKSS